MDTTMRLTDRKHEAIVQAAMTLFQTYGFDGTSMDRVSEAANVSKRTLYNHFPSKEELFAECCRLAWPGGATPLDSYRPGHPLREQLTRFVEQKLRQFSEDKLQRLTRAALVSMLSSPEWAKDLLQRMGDLDLQTMNWVRAACEDGRLHNCDPAVATRQLEALFSGTALWPQVTGRQEKLSAEEQRKISREVVDLFLARYAPDELPSLAPPAKDRAKPSQKRVELRDR
jgi:TetR/AcrR family transcriptional regulator of autoinduction and epiphytic fitness